MLQWIDMHPYNAVHVVHIPGVLNLERLRASIDGCLEKLGLTNLALERDRAVFAYFGGATRSEVRLIADVGNVQQALEIEITRQINTAFAAVERFNPFRFFVVAGADSFFLGLVYFHPVADAESIVHLLKRMVDAYLARTNGEAADSLRLYPPRFDNLQWRSPLLLAKKIRALPALMRSLGRSWRPPYGDLGDFANGFVLFSLPSESLRLLTAASKSWDITMNDLFLALLLKSLSGFAVDRMQERRRRRISVGCIVNLRKDLALASRETFGLFLGSFVVSHEVPDGISLMNLALDVRRQTRVIKDQKLSLATSTEMNIARVVASFSSTENRNRFYRKHYPLSGGITNMNLNFLWDEAGREKSPDYFRAVSTGPVTPFVLSITTANDRINVGMTYRTTVFSRPQIEGVKAEFLGGLSQLAPPA